MPEPGITRGQQRLAGHSNRRARLRFESLRAEKIGKWVEVPGATPISWENDSPWSPNLLDLRKIGAFSPAVTSSVGNRCTASPEVSSALTPEKIVPGTVEAGLKRLGYAPGSVYRFLPELIAAGNSHKIS